MSNSASFLCGGRVAQFVTTVRSCIAMDVMGSIPSSLKCEQPLHTWVQEIIARIDRYSWISKTGLQDLSSFKRHSNHTQHLSSMLKSIYLLYNTCAVNIRSFHRIFRWRCAAGFFQWRKCALARKRLKNTVLDNSRIKRYNCIACNGRQRERRGNGRLLPR